MFNRFRNSKKPRTVVPDSLETTLKKKIRDLKEFLPTAYESRSSQKTQIRNTAKRITRILREDFHNLADTDKFALGAEYEEIISLMIECVQAYLTDKNAISN